jgi:hypothetical protein
VEFQSIDQVLVVLIKWNCAFLDSRCHNHVFNDVVEHLLYLESIWVHKSLQPGFLSLAYEVQ